MFSVGISEIIVIILVACLVIDPKKLPFIAKNIGVYYKKFIQTKEEILNYFKKVINHTDDQENNNNDVVIKEIIGDDGKTYKSYEIKKIPYKKEGL